MVNSNAIFLLRLNLFLIFFETLKPFNKIRD
jgi:hypothetical protein